MKINPNIQSTLAYQKVDRLSRQKFFEAIRNELDFETESQVESYSRQDSYIPVVSQKYANRTMSQYEKTNNKNQNLPGQIIDRRG
jgi:hypothetical protein